MQHTTICALPLAAACFDILQESVCSCLCMWVHEDHRLRVVSTNMVNAVLLTLLHVLLVVAGPLTVQNDADAQLPLSKWSQFPGFSIDLSEERLIQFDDTSDPVWMTELEKIEAKAAGKNFMDMLRPFLTNVVKIQRVCSQNSHQGPWRLRILSPLRCQ